MSGINKTLSLINKKHVNQENKKIKEDNKRMSSFILNKRYKDITNYKKKENYINKYSNVVIKKK